MREFYSETWPHSKRFVAYPQPARRQCPEFAYTDIPRPRALSRTNIANADWTKPCPHAGEWVAVIDEADSKRPMSNIAAVGDWHASQVSVLSIVAN